MASMNLRESEIVHTVEDAVQRIVSGIEPLSVERVPLLDALGRVLATPVASPLTLPAWDNSGDGRLCAPRLGRRGRKRSAPVTLAVLETVAAGRVSLARGGGRKLHTHHDRRAAPRGRGHRHSPRGHRRWSRARGDSQRSRRAPQRALPRRGHQTRDRSCSIAASRSARRRSACSHRWAHRRWMCTASRASPSSARAMRSWISIASPRRSTERRSSRPTATRSTRWFACNGGIPVNLGVARDDPADIRARIDRAAGCDLLVTSAGISAGEFDYLRPVLAEAGVTLDVWRVRMRPGAPLGFGLARANAVDRTAGKSGVDDGDLRAVRAPGDAPHARPHASLSPSGAR